MTYSSAIVVLRSGVVFKCAVANNLVEPAFLKLSTVSLLEIGVNSLPNYSRANVPNVTGRAFDSSLDVPIESIDFIFPLAR